MKRSDVFPSQYLAKDDVNPPVQAIIKEVVQEMVSGDDTKENKPVMHFRDGIKPMILNTTNWTVCEESFGLDSDDWTGKAVELYVDPTVMYAGKRVGGVRLRIPASGAAAPARADANQWATIDDAVAALSTFGIDKAGLVAQLKERGISAWNSAKCSPIVKELMESEIPF
jgi:hypothetical protein